MQPACSQRSKETLPFFFFWQKYLCSLTMQFKPKSNYLGCNLNISIQKHGLIFVPIYNVFQYSSYKICFPRNSVLITSIAKRNLTRNNSQVSLIKPLSLWQVYEGTRQEARSQNVLSQTQHFLSKDQDTAFVAVNPKHLTIITPWGELATSDPTARTVLKRGRKKKVWIWQKNLLQDPEAEDWTRFYWPVSRLTQNKYTEHALSLLHYLS